MTKPAPTRGATDASRSSAAPPGDWPWPVHAALAALLLAYFAWFFAQPLAELPARDDGPWYRWQLVESYLVPEAWIGAWFGDDPPSLRAVVDTLDDRVRVLFWALLLLATAWRLGEEIVRSIAAPVPLAARELAVLSVGLGLSALSLLTLAIGLAGLLGQPWLARGALALVWLVSAIRRIQDRRTPDHGHSQGDTPRSSVAASRWQPAAGWLALPFALALLAGSPLPPVDFDVREYHLQAPKEFFQAGRIGFLPHNVYANMPLGAEMLSLLAMTLSGDWFLGALAGKVLIASFALVAALSLVGLASRVGAPAAGIWGAVLWLSTPWVVRLSSSGLIDVVVGCYLLLALHATWVWAEAETTARESAAGSTDGASPWWLMLAGFLAGSALACKYPAALFVVLPLGAAVVAVRASRLGSASGWRSGIRSGFWFAAGALVAAGPWLAKNAWLTGNPVYPLLADWLDGFTRTAELNARWNAAHAPHGFGWSALADSLLSLVGRSPWLSVGLLPGLLLAWFDRDRRRLVVAGWLLVGWVVATWWLFTHRIDRFWIPVLPVVALLAGLGWQRLLAPRRGRWAYGLLVAGTLALLPLATVGGPGTDVRYFVPLDQLRHDVRRTSPWRAWLNDRTEPGEAVLAVGDAEVFDLEMPVYYHTAFDPSPLETWIRGGGLAELGSELSGRGIAYVYVDWGEIARYRQPGNYGFTDFIQPELFQQCQEARVLEVATQFPPPRDATGEPVPPRVIIYRVLGGGIEGEPGSFR